MGTNWGALAGGLADGMQAGQRMQLARERGARENEQWGLQRRELERQGEQRDRESQVWVDLNSAIERRLAQRAAGQAPGVQPPGMQAPGVQSPAVGATGDAGVETTPLQPTPGLQERPLDANAAPAAPDYVFGAPGAASATPATPGLERRGPTAAAAPVGDGAAGAGQENPSQRIGFNLYSNPNLLRDPDFLNEAAQIFLKAKMPQGVKWLEMGFAAQEKNALDGLKALASGNVQRAMQMLNASDAKQITAGADKGKWQVQFPGGESRVVDPGQELKSFLDPKEFFGLIDKERDDARASDRDKATARNQDRLARVAERNAGTGEQNARSNEQYRLDQAKAAAERNRILRERGSGGAKPMSDKDFNNLSAKVASQLRTHMRDTAPTDVTGKKQPNPLSEFVPDIQEAVMADVRGGVEPEVAFNNRYVEWAEKFDKADAVLGQAFDKAREAGSGMLSGRKDAVASLRSSLRALTEQGISVDEARRFAQASKRDMTLFREAAQGLASGQTVQTPGLQRRGATTTAAVDTAPAGVPSGSRKVGTSGGKAVWQAPDGKRYIED